MNCVTEPNNQTKWKVKGKSLANSEALLATMSAIYELPGNAGAWPTVLERLSELCGSSVSSYMSADNEHDLPDINATWGSTDEDIKVYRTGWAVHDIRLKYSENLIPGEVFREFEFIPDRGAFDQSEWVRFRLKTRGLYYCLAARVSQHRLWNDLIFLNRSQGLGPYSDAEKRSLQDVLPHLSRAAELHRIFTSLNERFGAVLAVLDKLLVGLVILDDKGRVVVANESARRTCDNTRNLKLTTDRMLHTTDEDNDRLLQRFIASTGATSIGAGKSAGGRMEIARRSGRLPLLLEVMPIRDDGLPDGDNVRGSAVFIIDPDQSEVLSTEGLSRIFGLTLAEQQVAASVVNGFTIDRVAEERGTASGTVRGQIKSIFSKTGTNSQSDLVRLAAKATPPIARDDH